MSPVGRVVSMLVLVATSLFARQAIDGFRVASSAETVQIRIQVVYPGGTALYDSDWKSGNILDWNAADLPYGSYRLRIFSKDLEGRITENQTSLEVSADGISIDPALPEELKLTTTAHDGTSGALITTSGDLSFRFGDYLKRKDIEAMRLTADGNLDVKGWIRPGQGILFPDGSTLTSAFVDEGGRARPSRGASKLHPGAEATGAGTMNQIAKWLDNIGTLGDSEISESGGNVGIGTATPSGKLHIFGAAAADVFAGMGVDMIAGPAFNFGYGGASFGRGAGFLNVRPDVSAVAPNPSLRFMTGNVQRMIITNLGNVGIGTSTPGGRLHVFAAPTSDVFAGIGTDMTAGPSMNFGYGGATFGRGAGFFNVRPDLSAAAPNPSLRFMTANVERMIITNVGNIGVGTSLPGQPLDVVGNIRSSAAIDAGSHFDIAGHPILSNPGVNNTVVGIFAGGNLSSGSNNTFVGTSSGLATTTGTDNSYLGVDAGGASNGSGNSYFGSEAGASATGSNNSFFGNLAGYGASGNNSGSDNALFGRYAGFALTTGGLNSFFGVGAGQSNTTGEINVFIGRSAGLFNTTGRENVALGYNTGLSNTTEGANTFLGSYATAAAGVTNATAIGFRAQVTQSNSLVLGSINGQNSATADTRVGIGVSAPQKMLSIRDGVNIDQGNTNNGTIPVSTLTFGSSSGEGIGSKRTTGGNQFGLDFYTASATRMTIANTGAVDVAGDLHVGGTLTKSGGSFKIDHPLDPEHKYLYHSFVESPDMMNIYNGNTTLDANGEATVELPEWFEALNQDFRYQLTCLHGFAPVYVSEEVANNRFRISGGKAGLKVSWQITGIRHDAFANLHRIPVEQDKPVNERGTFAH